MSKFDKALVGDDLLGDPRMLGLPRGVQLLYIEALVWSADHKTDGHVPVVALPKITSEPDAEAAAALLVDAGLWAVAPGGWQLDWSGQATADDIAKVRELDALRMRRSRQHRLGDHSLCIDPKRCKYVSVTRDVTGDVAGNVAGNDTPYQRNSTQPKRSGVGKRSRAASAGAPARARSVDLGPLDNACYWCGWRDVELKREGEGGVWQHTRKDDPELGEVTWCIADQREPAPGTGSCGMCMGQLPAERMVPMPRSSVLPHVRQLECGPDIGCGGTGRPGAVSGAEPLDQPGLEA